MSDSESRGAPARPPAARPQAASLPEPTGKTTGGWHCLHMYYRVAGDADPSAGDRGRALAALDPDGPNAPERVQTSIVSGHKADLGVTLMDPDPLKIDMVVQEVRAAFGRVLVPAWSFVSITEVSEYVPTVAQYSERLIKEGLSKDDPSFRAKVAGYEKRLPMMNVQRLTPVIPDLPVVCFYPMNKIRHPHANWYTLPFSERGALMAEHATSGIKFAGRVSQLITASTGFDDWEWGVTLWGRRPEDVKEIVYTMRFDAASAHYAEFGPFYVGYAADPRDAFEHLRI